jgi:Ferritin-like
MTPRRASPSLHRNLTDRATARPRVRRPRTEEVVNVATAQQAIGTIIEQGEGTATSPEEGIGRRVAHYYRFMQIQKGRLLIPVSGGTPPRYAYAGPEVKLDPRRPHL